MGNSFEQAARKPGTDSPENPSRRDFIGKMLGEKGEGAPADLSKAESTSDMPTETEEEPGKLSRRRFLELMSNGVGAAYFAGLMGKLIKDFGGKGKYAMESLLRERREAPLSELVLSAYRESFEAAYAIPLVYDENPHWTERADSSRTDSTEAWMHEKIQATKELIETCESYPSWLIRDMNIPSITIRRDVRIPSRGEIGGRASLLDNRIILNAASAGIEDAPYLDRTSIHHELFHVIDPFKTEQNDAGWIRLNRDQGAEYSAHSREELADPPREGFASTYGETDSYEDRATIYEKLWENPRAVLDRKSPASLAGDDPLENKGQLLEQAMFLRSRGMFTREFWYQNAYGSEEMSELGWTEPFVPEKYFKKMEKEILGSTYEQIKKSHPEFRNITPQTFAEWQKFYLDQSGAK